MRNQSWDTRLFMESDPKGTPFIYSRTLIGEKLFPARCSISLFRILALYISTLLRSAVCRSSVGENFKKFSEPDQVFSCDACPTGWGDTGS